MGKVLGTFTNGFTGAVSRSIDNIIVSMKNGSGGEIPFARRGEGPGRVRQQ